MALALIVTSIIICLDQLSKSWILQTFAVGESLSLIENFFSISHVRNSGAAWGLLSGYSWGINILTIISILASLLLAYLLYCNRQPLFRFYLSLILGGSLGNLIDRLRFGNVVDWLSFKFGNYHFPSFNIADSAIVLGAILLAATAILKPDFLDQLDFVNPLLKKNANTTSDRND